MPASVASGTGPAVVVVVEADDNRAIVARELTNRYTADYSVYVESSASAALERLDALGVAGDDVALVLAEQWMEEMTGATLLARAHDLHPLARRGLLITWGQPPDRRQAVLQACALGQADYYLAWPEQPSDERFHRGMVEFLDEWWRLHGRPTETIRVVAEAHSARAHEMRDLLQRHELAYGFYDCDSEAGQAILAQAGVAGEHRPVVVMYDGRAR